MASTDNISNFPRDRPASPEPDSRGIVLVTGGTSHTGERVVRRLVDCGTRVRLLTRDPEKPTRLGMPSDAIEVAQGDLRKPWTLWQALEGCTALIHVAHIRFGQTCARACRGIGVSRLVAVSSTRLYTRWPCETSRAVARGESAIATSGLEYTILRASMIYGGTRDNNFTRLVRWIQRHRWVPLVSAGRCLIQPVYVDDLADLIVSVLKESRTYGRTFTVAGPQPVSYRRVMELLAEGLGRRVRFLSVPGNLAVAAAWMLEHFLPNPPVHTEQVRRLLEDKAANIDDARTVIGFSPRSVEEGIAAKLQDMESAS